MAKTALYAEPILPGAIIKMEKHLVWCASMIQGDNGICHLFFSVWPEEIGHNGWVTHSRIAYSSAEKPEGPYLFHSMLFTEKTSDNKVTHNPTVMRFGQKYYIYFMENTGNGEFWNHRNNQKICAASAESLGGPWKRFEKPLLPSENDLSCTGILFSNPSVTMTLDGRFLMIYKWVDNKNPPPFYGPVRHGAALAETPEGPFIPMADNLFCAKDSSFPGEDPFVFTHENRYYAILKDNGTFFSQEERALVMFESMDGLSWHPAEKPLALTRRLVMPNGEHRTFDRMERPQLSFCKDRIMMFCAVKPDAVKDESFAVGFNVVFQ